MIFYKVILFISLVVVPFKEQGVGATETTEICYNQFQVKMPVLQQILNLTTEIPKLYTTCDSILATDCCQIKTTFPLVQTGLYEIKDECSRNNTFNHAKIHVRCDMETDGGGWIVIQRRNASLGTVNFTRNWEDYENGFGDLDGEFWIGLNNIYKLTNQWDVDLQITLWNDTENAITWNYPVFRVSGPEDKYRLTVSSGTGKGGFDSFGAQLQNGRYFSTYDQDNDIHSTLNCGYRLQGGWWYTYCSYANLNGRHEPSGLPGTSPITERIFWYYGGSNYVYFNNVEMKIRSKACGLA